MSKRSQPGDTSNLRTPGKTGAASRKRVTPGANNTPTPQLSGRRAQVSPGTAEFPSLVAALREYAPAPEDRGLARLREHYGLFINGEFDAAADGRSFSSINPATGEPLAEVAWGGQADVERAVSAARLAFTDVWSPMPAVERAKYLFRIARRVAERSRELAVVESLDNGKPIKESRDFDLPLVSQHFFYYAGWADKLEYAGLGPDVHPLGVVGQIIPWNFPLLMAAWKIAPALACGNTVVLKPAETTPLTALILAEILQEIELPPGVVNIIPGHGDTGESLVSAAGVNKIAFTGSTAVGRRIAQSIAGTGTRLTLELGGKSANIVYEDADVPRAVEGAVDAIFTNQGHVCCAGSRLLLHESVADEFLYQLRSRMEEIRVGDPLDKNTDLGAINSPEQLARITSLVEQGVDEGADRWSPPSCSLADRGNWFAPTLLTGVDQASVVARTEIFGPVLCVLTFRTPEEAVAKANNTPYGLAAGVWTQDGPRALWTAQQLRAGVVWENCYNRFDPASAFGGYQESGYGREGGRVGLEAYCA